MEQELTKELRSIKRGVWVGALGFLLIGISTIIFSVSIYTLSTSLDKEEFVEDVEYESSDEFWDSANELYVQGEIDQLKDYAEKRLKAYPKQSSAYWYIALAHYAKEEWELALKNLDIVEKLSPNWEAEFTKPLREKIKELK